MIFRLFFSLSIHRLQILPKKLKLARFQIGILIKIYICLLQLYFWTFFVNPIVNKYLFLKNTKMLLFTIKKKRIRSNNIVVQIVKKFNVLYFEIIDSV